MALVLERNQLSVELELDSVGRNNFTSSQKILNKIPAFWNVEKSPLFFKVAVAGVVSMPIHMRYQTAKRFSHPVTLNIGEFVEVPPPRVFLDCLPTDIDGAILKASPEFVNHSIEHCWMDLKVVADDFPFFQSAVGNDSYKFNESKTSNIASEFVGSLKTLKLFIPAGPSELATLVNVITLFCTTASAVALSAWVLYSAQFRD